MTEVDDQATIERPKPSDPRLAESRRRLSQIAQEAQAIATPATDVALFEIDETGQMNIPEVEEVAELFSERASSWLKTVYGEEWWKEFGYASEQAVVPIVLAEALVSRINIGSPNTPERMTAIFTNWLTGGDWLKVMEAFPARNVNTLKMVLYYALQRLEASPFQPKPLQHVKKQVARRAVRNTVALDNDDKKPVTTVKTVPVQRARTYNEQVMNRVIPPLSAEEAEKLNLVQQWAHRLGLDERFTKGLVQFFNPQGSTIMNRDNMTPVARLVDYISYHYESIENEQFGLKDGQKDILRAVLGAWGDPRDGIQRPQSLARYLQTQKMRGAKPEAIIGQVQQGLKSILDVDTERIGRLLTK